MAAAQLISRGKRRTAAYLKAFLSSDSETSRLQGHQDLHNLLEHFLSPERSIDDPENLEWLQWLVAGGDTPEDFAKIVRRHDNATTCGLVWTANFVAYRCRTCGISPCMSLCADCFQAGNHTGHDFNMFRSQAGGACDCGDTSVMKTSGFCHRHGPGRNMNVPPCPHDVLAVAEAIIPRILLRVVQHFRDHCRPGIDAYEADMDAVHDADSVLTYLHDLTRMGAAMRKVLTHFLTNPQTYKNFTYGSTPSDQKRQQYQQKSQENYQGALATIPAPPPPFSMEDIPALKAELVHQTFLEELMFWTLKYEFPQKMVTLLLQMLPDNDYKDAFTRTFVQHYSRVSVVLVKASDADTMSNRVVHISVQLFSNEDLTRQMVETHQLLEIVLAALVHMMENIQIQSALHDPDHNFHMVVNCSSSTLKDHRYWPLVSDLINILSHRSTAAMFMSNSSLLSMWAEFVSLFTGMNLNVRELEHHVEFEPNTYYAAFSAELEACASPMWTLVGHCKQKNTDHLCRAVIDSCLTTLQDWFDAICFQETPPPLQVSFHFPLHRHLAVFISQAVRNGAINIDTILGDPDFLVKLMAHPLQIQVALCEIHSGMWVRNGLQIKGQAMTYVQCHFCCSMIDLDIFLLQLCTSRLDPDYCVRTVLERFSVDEFLSLAVVPSALPMNLDQELSMLQGALLLLCTLQSTRTHLGLNERDLLRQEMVSQLCMSDRTHSQLMDLHPKMPERTTGSNQMKDFEATLKEVADFKAPNFEAGGMQQGTYTPKASVWEHEFDPIFILVRAVHRRDFQTAMDRYTTHMKQAGLMEGSESPWPPFRQLQKVLHTYQGIRKILNSKTLHGLLFCILWKALTLSQSLPEPIIYLCIYLLDMAVDPMCNKPAAAAKEDVASCVPDKRWEQWFPSSNILTNLRHEIQYISVPLPQQESMEDLEDIPEENEEDMDTASPTPSRLGFTLAPNVVRGGNVVVTRSREGQSRKSPDASTSSESRDQGSSSCDDTSGSEPMDTTSSSNELKIEVKQSILSMLVKLHDRLSKDTEHYQPPETWEDADLKWSRGSRKHKARDGAHVITRLLDRIAATCQENLDKLKQLCCKTTPKKFHRRASDGGDREERRRKARDKQAKLLAEFAAKQRTFLESTSMDEDDSGEGASAESPEKEVAQEEEVYDCVICGQTDPSTPDRPIGRVVLLLASSVLGHRTSKDEPPRLPCSDGATLDMLNCGNTYDLRQTVMQDNFQMSSCLQSVSVGWFGGVYVQSCGHFLHSDCHKSYIRSLRSPDYQHTTQNIDVDKGEFTCPLCRQLANSVLPCQPHQHPLQKLAMEKKRYGSHKKTTPAKEQIKSEQDEEGQAEAQEMSDSSLLNASNESEDATNGNQGTDLVQQLGQGTADIPQEQSPANVVDMVNSNGQGVSMENNTHDFMQLQSLEAETPAQQEALLAQQDLLQQETTTAPEPDIGTDHTVSVDVTTALQPNTALLQQEEVPVTVMENISPTSVTGSTLPVTQNIVENSASAAHEGAATDKLLALPSVQDNSASVAKIESDATSGEQEENEEMQSLQTNPPAMLQDAAAATFQQQSDVTSLLQQETVPTTALPQQENGSEALQHDENGAAAFAQQGTDSAAFLQQETDTAAKETDAAEMENGAAAAAAESLQETAQSATAAQGDAQQLDDKEKAALAQKAAEASKPEEKQKADQAQASTSEELPSQEDKPEDKKDEDSTKGEKDKESGRVSPEFPRSIPTPWRQQAHVMKENQTLDPKPEFQRMIKDLGEVLRKATNADCEDDSILRQGVEAIMEDITKATYPKYKVFPKSSVDESLNVFVHSVARTNLELELVQIGNTIVNHSSTSRKFGFVDLLHVLRFHFNATGMDSLWSKLTTLYSDEEESMLVEKRETPMVLRDATALLIQLTLSLPWPISKAHFTCIVRVLFTLLYTQSLVDISCRFSEEERRAWREAGTDKAASTERMMTESMLSCLISHLVHTPLYHDTDTDLQRVDISQSVWSPHSVEHHIQKYCIHSLRIAALLRRHLFKEDLPDCQDSEQEFQTLVKFLDLQHVPPPTRGDASAVRERPFTSASCLHWAVPATQMISHWCQDFTSFVNRKQGPAKSLLLKNFAWQLPCLLRPPSSYDSIFQYHRQRQCTMCCSVPKEPALCMVCGELLCMKGGCCRQQSVMECVQHSISCGAGTGVFLVVNSSTIIVVRGPRACLWGSLYLDSHGEEDRDLRRGRPLYLSEDRFRVLTQQWISHSFDHMCKRWLWHHNRL